VGPPRIRIDHAAPKGGRRSPLSVWRATSGATAVEFALIAAPLFGLLIAILQTSLLFFAQEYLQTATTQASRQIMTGQAQTQGITAAQFKQTVCNNVSVLLSCNGVYVNVKTFTSFSSVTTPTPVQNGVFSSANLGYTLGSAGDVELVQVFYQWPVLLGPLGFNLSNMNGNYNLIVGTAVFRNEPYH
jgi:Flp pilus assembly protein TadG